MSDHKPKIMVLGMSDKNGVNAHIIHIILFMVTMLSLLLVMGTVFTQLLRVNRVYITAYC